MGSKYFSGKNAVDLTRNFVNIDTLLDVFTTTQKSLNQNITFKEEFSEKPSEEKPEEVKEVTKECHKCPKECEKKKKFDFELGSMSDEFEDEEDDHYICEYCNALGYSNEYKPEVCDSCSQCESCAEFLDEECSGCSFSVYRDGKFYREKLTEDKIFSENDLETFNSLELDKKGGRLFPRTQFTVNNM